MIAKRKRAGPRSRSGAWILAWSMSGYWSRSASASGSGYWSRSASASGSLFRSWSGSGSKSRSW